MTHTVLLSTLQLGGQAQASHRTRGQKLLASASDRPDSCTSSAVSFCFSGSPWLMLTPSQRLAQAQGRSWCWMAADAQSILDASSLPPPRPALSPLFPVAPTNLRLTPQPSSQGCHLQKLPQHSHSFPRGLPSPCPATEAPCACMVTCACEPVMAGCPCLHTGCSDTMRSKPAFSVSPGMPLRVS